MMGVCMPRKSKTCFISFNARWCIVPKLGDSFWLFFDNIKCSQNFLVALAGAIDALKYGVTLHCA